MNFSPKIEIINHFDQLINRIDIDIEETLEKCDLERILGETKIDDWIETYWWLQCKFNVKFFDTADTCKQHETLYIDLWSESTKVIDYLKQIRIISIQELRKAQERTLENYKLNRTSFKSELSNNLRNIDIDDLKSRLFADQYFFQIYFKHTKRKLCAFKNFSFVTDFYMSPSDIESLEKLINAEKDPFRERVFDEKMVLIGLLYSRFIQNLTSSKRFPPKPIIRVSKREVLNINWIDYRYDFVGVNLTNPSIIDLSRLNSLSLGVSSGEASVAVRIESMPINIEGLFSLESMYLGLKAAETYSFSIRNLYKLKQIMLKISGLVIDQQLLTVFLDKIPNIEEVRLFGNFSYFNLDHLVNLKSLALNGNINDDFNFELFKNLCYQLQILNVSFRNDYESISAKLFDGHCFSNLQEFTIFNSNLKILKKKFIDKFPILQYLHINHCNVKMIEYDAFSNVKQLTKLNFMGNFFKTLEKRIFSQLTKLEELYLRNNRIESVEKDFFSDMKNLKVLDVAYNNFSRLYSSETFKYLNNLEKIILK